MANITDRFDRMIAMLQNMKEKCTASGTYNTMETKLAPIEDALCREYMQNINTPSELPPYFPAKYRRTRNWVPGKKYMVRGYEDRLYVKGVTEQTAKIYDAEDDTEIVPKRVANTAHPYITVCAGRDNGGKKLYKKLGSYAVKHSALYGRRIPDKDSGTVIDHINTNPFDERAMNLREISNQLNSLNTHDNVQVGDDSELVLSKLIRLKLKSYGKEQKNKKFFHDNEFWFCTYNKFIYRIDDDGTTYGWCPNMCPDDGKYYWYIPYKYASNNSTESNFAVFNEDYIEKDNPEVYYGV